MRGYLGANGTLSLYLAQLGTCFFTDRTNDGVTIGMAGDRFAPGNHGRHALHRKRLDIHSINDHCQRENL